MTYSSGSDSVHEDIKGQLVGGKSLTEYGSWTGTA